MKRLLCFGLLAVAFASGALADQPKTGFIREADTVTLDTSGSRLAFTNASDGRLSFALTWISSTGSETIAMSKEGFFKKDGWFVYIESPTRIWMFDGVRQLDLVTRSKDKNGRYSVTTKGVFETCPQTVWDAVPESVRSFCMTSERPNHALQRTRPSRRGCNPTPSRAESLSLGR